MFEPGRTGEPAEATRVRRRFQFSLRTLLIGTTCLAVLLTVGMRWVAPAQRQRAVVKTIERLGGSVRYVDAADEAWFVIKLRDWLPRDYFDEVVGVRLRNVKLSDAEQSQFGNLRKLEFLDLDGARLTDSGLVYLEQLTALRRLNLASTGVTDAGIAHLNNLRRLNELDLSGTRVTNAGLVHLDGLEALNWLMLMDTAISDAGLEHLQGRRSLHRLGLSRTNVSDGGLEQLRATLPNCSLQDKWDH